MRITDEMIAEDEKRWHARDVVMELDYCSTYMRDRKDITNLDIRFYAYIMRKARDLLKEQEPRVLTLEEVLGLKFDDVVYLQVYPTNVVISSIVVDVRQRIPEINTGVVQFRHAAGYNGINNADLGYYGKTWRCWSAKPTEEQREATPWQD